MAVPFNNIQNPPNTLCPILAHVPCPIQYNV